ncbi:Retrovirus-related Pol polyprotein from transposon TNT 1-94 [Vitis vinifera]|uniref:Retrovirus-related Pol polyprotein from transposon TNT 1-94 n=1 Tax=Vitis vinifera TaxID=29760 RepID=A0A438DAA8_VITVI|nr:Retrovirus-related Pol polyprotein from transposon TNT 1-94 [Vitis vinifera]
MEDHENFGEFHAKLMDIVNSSFNLGEPIPNSKVVRKILRSFPERFRAKVIAIEESKDVDSLKVDELVGSLQTFEMTLGSPRKSKDIALNVIKEESLGKSNVKDKKKDKSVKKDLEVECFKCGGKRHYATECPSKKKGKKAMQVTWSDSESCQSSEKKSNASEECTNFTAFMASVIDEPLKKEVLSESYESSDSNGDEMSFDSAYETLYKECLNKIAFLKGEHFDMKKMCDELKSENQVFKNELSLRKEESHPNSKRLSDLINLGRKSFDKRGLGFVDEATTPSSGKTIFVKSREEVVPKKIPPKLKLHCTHCTKMGHTIDRCYARMFESFQRKLTNLMNESFTLRNRLLQGGKRVFKRDSNVPHYSGFQGSTSNGMTKVTNVKQIWVKKSELNFLVVHTALRASELHSWYFDSGCSHHMTGNRLFFTNFTEFDGGNVTFGDGNVASVKGKGTICAPGIPNLEEGNCVMIGLRTSDNCYAVLSKSFYLFSSSLMCGSSKIESIDLWHRRLGHLNYRDLMKVANNVVIKGIPKLGKPSNPTCGPCQKGKQTRSTHKRVDEILTSKPLELLHMDLMGPMRTESLGGKKYILVMVDDYSRYAWVAFLRDKSETFINFKDIGLKIQNEKGHPI